MHEFWEPEYIKPIQYLDSKVYKDFYRNTKILKYPQKHFHFPMLFPLSSSLWFPTNHWLIRDFTLEDVSCSIHLFWLYLWPPKTQLTTKKKKWKTSSMGNMCLWLIMFMQLHEMLTDIYNEGDSFFFSCWWKSDCYEYFIFDIVIIYLGNIAWSADLMNEEWVVAVSFSIVAICGWTDGCLPARMFIDSRPQNRS